MKKLPFNQDLVREYGLDLNKKYKIKNHTFTLRDINEGENICLTDDGKVDKRTFIHKLPNFGAKIGGKASAERWKKVKEEKQVARTEQGGFPLTDKEKRQLADPKELRALFQSSFTNQEVLDLLNKAKEMAIDKGDIKMIQFLIEQLFGKAQTYTVHAGDKDRPFLYKDVSRMSDDEVDEYLNEVTGSEVEEKTNKTK